MAQPSGAWKQTRGHEALRLELLCRGVVQGVGFRPCLVRLAASLGLQGSVANVAAGVRLELQGERRALQTFLECLPRELPAAGRLDGLDVVWRPPRTPAPCGLRIAASEPSPLGLGLFATALAADRAPCEACLRELAERGNRRQGHLFISCCSCGPRYSIATHEPFSRAGTTLARFPLCPACQAEFDDPGNRRFHAETICCPDCGPQWRLLGAAGALLAGPARRSPGLPSAPPAPASLLADRRGPAVLPPPDDPLSRAVALLHAGAILALQGVGGFQLLVLARDAAAVARLRQRKRRPHKPLALLVDHPHRLRPLLQPNPAELRALHDPAAAIVLLPCPAADHATALPGVAPGAAALGVMLAASPMHRLLAAAVAEPLVATSGNRSGEPLCRDPAEALERLAGIADAFLVHDRPIARRLDDSVLQLIEGRPALLRRSRGYAPESLPLADPRAEPLPAAPPADLLALGGDLKAAPALALGSRVLLAPHLGDLEDRRCQQLLRQGLADLAPRWADRVQAVLGDRHPDGLGRQLAASWPRPLPWHGVQHHLAHALAVMAEHGLQPPLLALCADGLGYGEPEAGHQPALWGCELLGINVSGVERLASLRPLPLPGGDRAQREPRRLALGLLAQLGAAGLHHPGARHCLQAFEPAERQLLLQAISAGLHCPWSSSLGRLFDAAASLLGLCQQLSYEGQGGLLLQGAASGAAATATAGRLAPYPLPCRPAPGLPLGWLDWQPLLQELLADAAAARSAGASAWRFHAGVSQGLAAVALQAARRLERRRQQAQRFQDRRAAGPTSRRWEPATAPAPASGVPAAVAPACGNPRPGPAASQRRLPVLLAGGCFQNALLLSQLQLQLRQAGLEPYWAERLPGNDGGLALGQIWAVRLGLSITPLQPQQPEADDVPGRQRSDRGDPPAPTRRD